MSEEIERLSCDGNEEEFWSNFSSLTPQSSEFILSKASNVVSVKNIDFPNFENPNIINYFYNNITSQSDKGFIFKNCSFKKFDISKFNPYLKNIEFEDCEFNDDVNLSKTVYGRLKIYSCKFNNNSSFLIEGFDNNQNSRIIEIKNTTFTNSSFSIKNSNLNNTLLSNLKFINTPIILKDTNVNNLHLNKIIWGKNVTSDRDTFRELKFIMENQKNFIDSSFFHSLEMIEYKKELDTTKFEERIEDKILFNLNYLISNFSQSWFLPTIYLILFSIGMFTMGYIDGGKEVMECNLNEFFKFTNPLSRNSNNYDEIYTYWFIHKMVSIIFVYHIVVSLKNKMRK